MEDFVESWEFLSHLHGGLLDLNLGKYKKQFLSHLHGGLHRGVYGDH